MAISLANIGRNQRVFDEHRSGQEFDAYMKNQRAFEQERQGWQREDRPRRIALEDLQRTNAQRQGQIQQFQFEDGARNRTRQRTAEDAFSATQGGFADRLLAVAEAAKAAGDIEGYRTNFEAHNRVLNEGKGEVAKAALAGASKEELKAIKARYMAADDGSDIDLEDVLDDSGNLVDRKLIVTKGGIRGQPVSARAQMQALGLLKEDKETVLNPGDMLLKGGKKVGDNMAGLQEKQKLETQRLDHEYGLKRELEQFKARHGTSKTSALIENVEYLTANGVAKDKKEAFELLRTGMQKPEGQAILDLAAKLRTGSGYFGKDGVERSMADARRMVKGVRGGEGASAPGAARPTARTYTLRDKTFTDADVDATAKKHGIPREEVLKRLGVQ